MASNDKLERIIHEPRALGRPFIETTAIPHTQEAENEVALRYYLNVVLKHKWLIIFSVLLVTASAWFLLKRVQPLYEASATIKIDPENVDVLDSKAVFYQSWVDPEYFNTQLKLLTNPDLAKQVVQTLELDKNPDFLQKRPTTLTGAVYALVSSGGTDPQPAPLINKEDAIPDALLQFQIGGVDDATGPFIEEALSSLKAVPIPKTRLILITYNHHDPKTAQKMANAFAETFIRNNLERRVGRSKASSAFLQQRLASLQSEIRDAEEDLIQYGKTHEIVSLNADQNTVFERLAALNRQLLEAEASRKDAEAIYKLTLGIVSIDSVPEVLSSPIVRGLQERLSSLKQKRAELLVTYKEEWPEVKQIGETIVQVEKDLLAEKNKLISGIETRYRTGVERERLLRDSYNKQMGTTVRQNESAINYRIKQQEVDTRKELYKTILSQLKETDISSSSDVNNISLTTAAGLPKGAISPRIPLTLSIALFFSFTGSLCIAFIREYLNTKIVSVEDVDRFVNLPTLGLIPEFKPELISRSVVDLLSAGAIEQTITEQDSENSNDQALSAFKIPDSAVAEAYRHLRTSMILTPGMQNSKIILVTSSQPSEGKTTTAVNLATAMAYTGAKTVLIDADLRKPSLHAIFNIETKFGLSQYLSGYAQMEDIFNKTNVANLSVISSAGMLPLYPTEMLGSPKMRDLLFYLSTTRDYVIIDTPPILPFADAVILSSMVDGVLLVVNAEKSRRDVVKRARRILSEIGANLFGVVLNHVNGEKTSYGGYYGYGYKYSQGSTDNILKRAVATIRNFNGSTRAEKHKKNGVGDDLKIEIKIAVEENADASADGSDPTADQYVVTVGAADGIDSSKQTEREFKEEKEEKTAADGSDPAAAQFVVAVSDNEVTGSLQQLDVKAEEKEEVLLQFEQSQNGNNDDAQFVVAVSDNEVAGSPQQLDVKAEEKEEVLLQFEQSQNGKNGDDQFLVVVSDNEVAGSPQQLDFKAEEKKDEKVVEQPAQQF